MKYLLFLLCLTGLFSQSQAANITFVFANADSKPINITKPLNGKYYPGTLQAYTPNAENKCVINNDLTKPGIIQIFYGRQYSFYVMPGKNYVVSFKPKEVEQSFTFTGDDTDGQYLLNKIRHPDFQGKAAAYMRKDSTLKGIKVMIDTDAEAERQLFTALSNQKKISDAFYKHSILEIDYYYAAILGQIIYDSQTKPGFVEEWPQLFSKYSLNNEAALSTTSFHDYADQYASWYKTSYVRKLAGNNKRFDMKRSNEYLIDWYHRYADNLTGPTREYMLSRFLNRFVNMKKYEPELVDLYNDFNKLYPNNQYLPFLQPGVNGIIGYQAKAKQQTASAVQFVDDYSKINSLDELLSRFKNETVYVDIWATWCKPCKEEFAHAPDLRTFLQSKSAKMLYLSTDVDERNDDWKKMAANYNLNGLHMRTTNKLREDLIKQLWDGKTYSIPRYLLIKNGQIVIADALRPSDKQILYNQLSKFL